ncbi:MAG: RNA polymerase sigma factor [Gemmatimonadota bacterium]|nr:RNA polymerase sigma factor [Gemmatimonadota bacterium]
MTGLTPLLVARAQTGDLRALDRLLRELQEPLYRHVCGVLGDDALADDVLQDVLLIVARRIGTVREPAWVRAWAFRVANREAVRASKKARRYQAVIEEAVLETADDAADVIEPSELLGQIPQLVDSLPPGARVVVRLHYIDGLSNPEIAEALELPLGTVKSRLAYGLRLLRERSGSQESIVDA